MVLILFVSTPTTINITITYIIEKMGKRERNLVDICMEHGETGGFSKELKGNTYCSLSMDGRRVECPYLAQEEDKNQLYRCLCPAYVSGYIIDVKEPQYKN